MIMTMGGKFVPIIRQCVETKGLTRWDYDSLFIYCTSIVFPHRGQRNDDVYYPGRRAETDVAKLLP